MRLLVLLLFLCQWSTAQVNIVQLMGIEDSHLSTFETHKLTPKTAAAFSAMQAAALKAVSYTHLTLPTILPV